RAGTGRAGAGGAVPCAACPWRRTSARGPAVRGHHFLLLRELTDRARGPDHHEFLLGAPDELAERPVGRDPHLVTIDGDGSPRVRTAPHVKDAFLHGRGPDGQGGPAGGGGFGRGPDDREQRDPGELALEALLAHAGDAPEVTARIEALQLMGGGGDPG